MKRRTFLQAVAASVAGFLNLPIKSDNNTCNSTDDCNRCEALECCDPVEYLISDGITTLRASWDPVNGCWIGEEVPITLLETEKQPAWPSIGR